MKNIINKVILLISLFFINNSLFSITESSTTLSTSNIDPLENFNRNAYRMNSTLDKHILRPVTVKYITYVPSPIRYVVGNFYNNLRDFVSLGNDILQLHGLETMRTVMRISINSVVGLGGIIDVSSSLGLKVEKNTFGKTMKTYGWESSTYIVIPFLGPSTIRDAIGLIPDTYFNPTWYVFGGLPVIYSLALFAINGIDVRAQYLPYDQILQASLDPYVTIRDTYLQAIGQAVPNSSESNSVSIDELLEESETESSK